MNRPLTRKEMEQLLVTAALGILKLECERDHALLRLAVMEARPDESPLTVLSPSVLLAVARSGASPPTPDRAAARAELGKAVLR